MRKALITCLISVSFFVLAPQRSHAVIWVVIQEALKEVLLAMDEEVQRLQNETIGLQVAQKKLENTLSKLKLGEISDWAERQRKLYDEYYQELWTVKNVISAYRKIKQIIERQSSLVSEYQRAFELFKQDGHFTSDELMYIGAVYEGILAESLKNIEPIFLVIKSFDLQMSDASRLSIIQEAANNIDENIMHLRKFNYQNMILSLQRSRDRQEINKVKLLYGLP